MDKWEIAANAHLKHFKWKLWILSHLQKYPFISLQASHLQSVKVLFYRHIGQTHFLYIHFQSPITYLELI